MTAPEQTHRIRLAATDDTFLCRSDQTILAAGLAAGLRLPYECSTGSCGSCRARCVEGQVESRWPDAPGLSGRDRSRARILCCQSEPRSDVTIDVAQEPPGLAPRPGEYDARVTEIVPLTEDTIRIVCELGVPMRFLPGQFVLFVIPGERGRRAYSMCNTPSADGHLDFLVRGRPGGAATRHLFQELRPGDRLALEGPYGHAFLRAPLTRDLACAAGGSGLGPILSILRAALAYPSAADHRVTLVFGVRRKQDLFDVEVLGALARDHSNLELVYALSEPAAGEAWDGDVGFVHDVLLRRVPELDARDLYMAGPPPMIDALLRACIFDRKMLPDRIHFDRFS